MRLSGDPAPFLVLLIASAQITALVAMVAIYALLRMG